MRLNLDPIAHLSVPRKWLLAIHATASGTTAFHVSRAVPRQARWSCDFRSALLMQPNISQERMHDSLFNRILAGLRIQTTKGESEFLLDLGEHGDEA